MHACKAVLSQLVRGVNKSQVHSESFTCLDEAYASAWLPPPSLLWPALAFPAEILLLGRASHLRVLSTPDLAAVSVLLCSWHARLCLFLHSSSGHN